MNKRPRPADSGGGWERLHGAPPVKRLRADSAGNAELLPGGIASTPVPIAALSDEILIRILSFLSPQKLLAIATVSRRFERLCSDSQLWKSAYYARFVLPRAMRIPGFRHGQGAGPADFARNHKLHYKGRQALWADGTRGGLVKTSGRPPGARGGAAGAPREREDRRVDWKRQYKIRHNWARGKCAVEELKLAPGVGVPGGKDGGRMLAKVIEGVAITVDKVSGLRAWNLKTRHLLAQASIARVDQQISPTCLAVDDQHLDEQTLGIAIGFSDGSFSTWLLDCRAETLRQRYRHEQSSNGELISIAYLHPYLLTATGSVLASLYTFEGPGPPPGSQPTGSSGARGTTETTEQLAAPYLLTSLRSHTARSPLSLSVRRLPSVAVASIAYVFSTRQGWSIGMQELHIKDAPPGLKAAPEITSTRLVYTGHVNDGAGARGFSSPQQASPPPVVDEGPTDSPETEEPGPTTLCYTHPYLLATLPDNTLVLHVCTSTAATLSISPGVRLWGHTSGISDAEITARGRAVSVSSRGQEMRVWELEGKQAASHGRSVEIRPDGQESLAWDEQRNWVGFDDEMVIVLKESRDGQESLMVYDFT